jgi:hypothetical protein
MRQLGRLLVGALSIVVAGPVGAWEIRCKKETTSRQYVLHQDGKIEKREKKHDRDKRDRDDDDDRKGDRGSGKSGKGDRDDEDRDDGKGGRGGKGRKGGGKGEGGSGGGEIPPSDPPPAEDPPVEEPLAPESQGLDISTWPLHGQGGCSAPGTTGYCVEYLSPQTPSGSGMIDRVTIEYDRTAGVAVSAFRETMTSTGADYVRTALDPNLVTRLPYCTQTAGCLP